MDISGAGETADCSMDSTLCSCEELDTSAGQTHTCHSCGNVFTTTRTLSSDTEKVFCDDCSQMPEYLSRSSLDLLSTCDESGTLGRWTRRWSQRIHSNDSGVKVEGVSGDYRVTSGPLVSEFARKLAESLQSMCSECKMELEPGLGLGLESAWGGSSSLSLSSICTECRAHLEGLTYMNGTSPSSMEYDEISQEREEYMRRRKERLLESSCDQLRPRSTDNTLLLEGEEERREVEEGEEEQDEVHCENGFTDSLEKAELRQKNSDDSGIKMVSEPQHLKQASLGTTRELAIMCTSPPTSRLQRLTLSHPSSGCSTPSGRLSAHPRHRDWFHELGIQETDL